jgi:hypothetical protein
MALKTLLAVGLTSVAVAGGAAWGYVHYAEIFGNGGGCGTSECAPAACSSAGECSAATQSCCEETTAAKSCCDAPSRAAAVAQE